MKCKFHRKCKDFHKNKPICSRLGGMINRDIRTPYRCYLNQLDREFKKQKRLE